MESYTLVESVDQLAELLAPVLRGEVPRLAFDTETSLIRDGRFTPFGTDSRVAGFSMSWPGTDFYVPVRHRPYDWRRRPHLLERDTKHRGAHWMRALLDVERCVPFSEANGWQPAWAEGADPNVALADALGLLSDALRVQGTRWYAHNWPFDAKMLLADGLELPWDRMPCTQALSTFTDERPQDLWDEEANRYVHGGHGLKHLGEVYLGIPAEAQAELEQAKEALGKGSAKLDDYSMLPLRSALAKYAAMDTHLTLKLADLCEGREAYKDPRVRQLLDMHMAERRVFIEDMEAPGIPVDSELASQRAVEKEKELERTLVDLNEAAGTAVPVEDPKKLAPFLYEELGLPQAHSDVEDTREATLKKIRTKLVAGGTATEKGVGVTQGARVLDGIMAYRRVQKELTAFYRPLSQHTGGRVHPVLSPIRSVTLRATAEKPNAYQFKKPKKGATPDETRQNQLDSVRHLIKPEPGRVFLACDYSAQEMRLSAHYSQAIPRAFAYRFTWRCTKPRRGSCKGRGEHGLGIVHTGWREDVSRVPEQLRLVQGFMEEGVSFDPHQRMVALCEERTLAINRDQAKTAVYAILYGAGAKKLSETLDCQLGTARELIRIFWDEAYPELGRVRAFVDERLRRVGPSTKWSHQSYVTTLNGGRVYLDSGYKGMNALVQRSGREMLLKAILSVKSWLVQTKAHEDYRIMLAPHDELILDADKRSLDEGVVAGICKRMVEAGEPSTVPMVVEPNLCEESWAVKQKLPQEWGCDGVALLKAGA